MFAMRVYTTVMSQAPIPEQAPTPQFWQFCGFSRFSVTAHHAKFLRSEFEGRSTELT